MTTQGIKRKLAAILSADVEGYSRLMSQDEVGTIRTLTAYKEAMATLIQQYKGRVVDTPGDNLLAEFASVVDAVNCAVEIQRELAERNAELPYSRKMEFRIGVNLGDVVEEEGRIYGDGVNIAARIESLAEGGGICVSGTAYDQVENKLGLEYESLGEQEVKNIEKPVRVYRVLSFPGAAAHRVIIAKKEMGRRWAIAALAVVGFLVVGVAAILIWNHFLRPASSRVEPASMERMALPLPDKPSIAVLPFVNMTGDPEQEYFSDGLTEHIITSLSKIPHLFVIARNSTFAYKGKTVKVKQVAEELGVQYVLEGSVQRAANRLRLEAQLIDALAGHHVWAESYDRSIGDIFDLQDDITKNILTAMQVTLANGEWARAAAVGTSSLKALENVYRALFHTAKHTKESSATARRFAEKAVELDPQYPMAWSMLGWTHAKDAMLGFSKSRSESLKLAEGCAQKALDLNESDAMSLLLIGRIWSLRGDFDKAIAYQERAIEASPNDSWMYLSFAFTLNIAGMHERSIAFNKKAMRLSPHFPAVCLRTAAYASFFARQYDEALKAGEELLGRAKKGEYPAYWAYLVLAATYIELGREEKAHAYVNELLKHDPSCRAERFQKAYPMKNEAETERFLSALRKAGLN